MNTNAIQSGMGSQVLTGPQRLYCEGIVRGWPAREAYRQAYPGASARSVETLGCLLRQRPHVQAEIRRLREKVEALAGEGVLTAYEKRVFLARLVRLPFPRLAEELEAAADLINGVIPGARHSEILIPNKLTAIQLDNALAGHGGLTKLGRPTWRTEPLHAREFQRLAGQRTNADRWQEEGAADGGEKRRVRVLTEAQERFCEAVVAGLNGKEAYLEAYPQTSLKWAAFYASRVWSMPEVQAQIFRLREALDLTKGSAVLTLLEKRQFLARIVRMHGMHVRPGPDGDLIKRVVRTAHGPRYVLYSKLAAIRMDNLLAGHVAGRMVRGWN